VERLKEYQQARRMPALQHFVSDLEKGDETCDDMTTDAKCFILCFRKRDIWIKC
jgi:hypothetical protein